MSMNTKLYMITGIFVLVISNGIFYHLYSTNSDKLDQTEKKLTELESSFNQYKEKLDSQIKQYNTLNEKFASIQSETNTISYKLKKDASREHVVEAKPGLVSKLINGSFKKFTDSVVEETQ